MIASKFRAAPLTLIGTLCAAALLYCGTAAYAAEAASPAARTSATDHSASAGQPQSPAGTLPAISAATAPAPVIDSIDVKPGDRWVFSITDDITGDLLRTLTSTVTEIQGQTITAQNAYLEATAPTGTLPRLNTFIYDQWWNTMGDGTWTWKPGIPSGIKLPLKLGVQWTTKLTASRQAPNLHYLQTYTSKVTSWDHVTLPSGLEFDAYRIEMTYKARQNPQRLIEGKATYWYAPEANRVVWHIEENRLNGHLTERVIQSLTEYKRRSGN